MKKSTLFYHPKNADCKKAEKLLNKKKYDFDLSDVSANGTSSYLYKDMRISRLPALYVFSGNKYRVYEGLGKIEALLNKKR